MATSPLLDRLERHYIKPGAPLPGGIFLREVGWNGGNAGTGGCDAIYVGFTSTSGRVLVGHELKVSRADWLRELNRPGKADGWADECHQWWLVVSDPLIVKDGELPPGWGLMSPGRSVTRMDVHVKPETKPYAVHQPSWRAVRSIMARQDTLRSSAIFNARQKAQAEAYAAVEEQVADRLGVKLTESQNNGEIAKVNRERLRKLEMALGVNIHWDGDKPGWSNQASLPEVEAIAEVLRETRTTKRAISTLLGRVNEDALDRMRRQIVDLQKTLGQLKEEQ